jgi:hypothetical protein
LFGSEILTLPPFGPALRTSIDELGEFCSAVIDAVTARDTATAAIVVTRE